MGRRLHTLQRSRAAVVVFLPRTCYGCCNLFADAAAMGGRLCNTATVARAVAATAATTATAASSTAAGTAERPARRWAGTTVAIECSVVEPTLAGMRPGTCWVHGKAPAAPVTYFTDGGVAGRLGSFRLPRMLTTTSSNNIVKHVVEANNELPSLGLHDTIQ